ISVGNNLVKHVFDRWSFVNLFEAQPDRQYLLSMFYNCSFSYIQYVCKHVGSKFPPQLILTCYVEFLNMTNYKHHVERKMGVTACMVSCLPPTLQYTPREHKAMYMPIL